MADTFVKVALIVIIIVLVGFLGVLTGYIVKPVTESTTTTTTLVTTQPTTTTHITTTTPEIEVVTTVPKVLCSPCFSYFAYRGHDDTYLLLRNGPRTISIKDVTFSSGENIQVLHKCTQFPCDVTITYTDIDTGVQHTDSATLNSPYPSKTISFMGASCADNQITLVIKNEGNVRINGDEIKIYVDDVYEGIFGHAIEPQETWITTVSGHSGTNNVKAVSPVNTAAAPVYCSGTTLSCSKALLDIVDVDCSATDEELTVIIQNAGQIPLYGFSTLATIDDIFYVNNTGGPTSSNSLQKGEMTELSYRCSNEYCSFGGKVSKVRVSPSNCPQAYVEKSFNNLYCSGTIVKTISVMAYSCDRTTDVITLTISNEGNTRIEEDEIEIYNNDKYIGTFGRTIEPGQLTINSFPGNPGQNTVEVVSPSNSARINVYCY